MVGEAKQDVPATDAADETRRTGTEDGRGASGRLRLLNRLTDRRKRLATKGGRDVVLPRVLKERRPNPRWLLRQPTHNACTLSFGRRLRTVPRAAAAPECM